MRAEPRLEVCADSLESCLAAEAGGAHRIELCAALAVGGVTPSMGLLAEVLGGAALPVVALVRPRAGDFLYDASEHAAMVRDIVLAREAGAAGIATGALAADGTVDRARTAALVAAARPLPVTFHRAFDMTRDLDAALETLIELGLERVLTSGGATDVTRGQEALAGLVARAGERILVMPGGGVRRDNAQALVRATGACELHASAASRRDSAMAFRSPAVLGAAGAPDEYTRTVTSADEVRAILAAARG